MLSGHNVLKSPFIVLVGSCLAFANDLHCQSTYDLMTLAPLLRIISMSRPSMSSLSSPHFLASQLPGALALSLEQSLFTTEDCAHYAADYM